MSGREQPPVVLTANALPLGNHDAVMALARAEDRLGDPVVRQEIASVYSLSEALRLTRARAAAAEPAGFLGKPLSPELLARLIREAFGS